MDNIKQMDLSYLYKTQYQLILDAKQLQILTIFENKVINANMNSWKTIKIDILNNFLLATDYDIDKAFDLFIENQKFQALYNLIPVNQNFINFWKEGFLFLTGNYHSPVLYFQVNRILKMDIERFLQCLRKMLQELSKVIPKWTIIFDLDQVEINKIQTEWFQHLPKLSQEFQIAFPYKLQRMGFYNYSEKFHSIIKSLKMISNNKKVSLIQDLQIFQVDDPRSRKNKKYWPPCYYDEEPPDESEILFDYSQEEISQSNFSQSSIFQERSFRKSILNRGMFQDSDRNIQMDESESKPIQSIPYLKIKSFQKYYEQYQCKNSPLIQEKNFDLQIQQNKIKYETPEIINQPISIPDKECDLQSIRGKQLEQCCNNSICQIC